ncbi:RNA polymerase sigma factor SigM [Catenulispora yoronensis]|uniref:RNA polymerase sigma factor SigM n=1 Tax=Catenulispora yoronensis TaxID=450799 RepID=A0ABP5FMR0_9ACTN
MADRRADLGLLDDRELLSRHAAGDAEAFGELFRRHRDRLWSVAVRTLGDPEEAADALQDAMLSAYRAAGSFRGDSAVTTWLHRVVVNACLDRIRRRATRPTVPLPEVETEQRQPGPTDDIANADLRLALTTALATLPEEQRMALVLVDVEGYTVEETARALGVAPGTVKSRCARARAKLLPLLRHLRDGSMGDPSDPDPGNRSAGSRVKISTRDDRREGGTAGW